MQETCWPALKRKTWANAENVRGCRQSRILDACLYTDLKETKAVNVAYFFVPDAKNMQLLLDADESSMLFFHT